MTFAADSRLPEAIPLVIADHMHNYGPGFDVDETQMLWSHHLADVLIAIAVEGLDVEDTIARARRTIAGEAEHFDFPRLWDLGYKSPSPTAD